MKIWIFSVCHNEAPIIPWYLRHYAQFADRILVWDDNSTDGSRELLKAHPLVTLYDWPHKTGLFEDVNLHHAYDVYPSARGKADWCMWVDMDELIWHPQIKYYLATQLNDFTNAVQPRGYNMTGLGLPVNGYEHKQIWEHLPMGVEAPNYSKPVIFKPDVKIRWIRGKHRIENVHVNLHSTLLVKLLHYRYLGAQYTAFKNRKNYERCGGDTGDKAAAWTCGPEYDGPTLEGSPSWAATLPGLSFNVIEAPL